MLLVYIAVLSMIWTINVVMEYLTCSHVSTLVFLALHFCFSCCWDDAPAGTGVHEER